MMSFFEFVNSGVFNNTAMDGIDNQFFGLGRSPVLPTPTLDLPTKSIEGIVKQIRYTENPISINLTNGTTWKLTKKQWDYLAAVNKLPRINSRVQIETFIDGTIKSANVYDQPSKPLTQQVGKSPQPLAQQTGMPKNKSRHMPF